MSILKTVSAKLSLLIVCVSFAPLAYGCPPPPNISAIAFRSSVPESRRRNAILPSRNKQQAMSIPACELSILSQASGGEMRLLVRQKPMRWVKYVFIVIVLSSSSSAMFFLWLNCWWAVSKRSFQNMPRLSVSMSSSVL